MLRPLPLLVFVGGCLSAPPAASSAPPAEASPVIVQLADPVLPMPEPMASAAAETAAGRYVAMSPIITARWSSKAAPSASLALWTEASYGHYRVLRQAGPAVRIALPKAGAELWPWVDVSATDEVLLAATPLRTRAGVATGSVLAAGQQVESVREAGNEREIEVRLPQLSTTVTLRGWVDRQAFGHLFTPAPLPVLAATDHHLNIPMYKFTTLFDREGAVIGDIEQGILAISAKPLGAVVDGRQRVAFTVEEDEEQLAYVDAYVDAAIVQPDAKQPAADGITMVEGTANAVPAAAAGTVAAGTCLYASPSGGKPIGVARRTLVAVPDSTVAVVELDNLRFWAGSSHTPACTPDHPARQR